MYFERLAITKSIKTSATISMISCRNLIFSSLGVETNDLSKLPGIVSPRLFICSADCTLVSRPIRQGPRRHTNTNFKREISKHAVAVNKVKHYHHNDAHNHQQDDQANQDQSR